MEIDNVKPSATVYVPIEPISLFGLKDEGMLRDFKTDILLKGQGEAVLLSEGMPFLQLIFAFSVFYGNASELAFLLRDGRKVLIFDRQENFDIRPKEIITTLSNKVELFVNAEHELSDDGEQETTLDFGKIWKECKKKPDVVEAVSHLIESYTPQFFSEKLILEGEMPALSVLVFLCLVRPYAREIFYKDGSNNMLKLF